MVPLQQHKEARQIASKCSAPPQKKKIPVGIFPQSHNLKQITCRPKAKEENYVDFSCASVCARARVRVFGAQSAHSLNLKGWKTKSIKLH